MATPKKTSIRQPAVPAATLPVRPLGDNTVRVHVSPDVIYNLDKYRAVTKSVLDKLGCPECHSGLDFRFETIREFKASARGAVKPATLATRPTEGTGGLVNVDVPAGAVYDFDQLDRIRQQVITKLGCGNCHSGFDIRFKSKILTFVADKKLNVQAM